MHLAVTVLVHVHVRWARWSAQEHAIRVHPDHDLLLDRQVRLRGYKLHATVRTPPPNLPRLENAKIAKTLWEDLRHVAFFSVAPPLPLPLPLPAGLMGLTNLGAIR